MGATVRPSKHADGTLLTYTADVEIDGKIAKLGARLTDSTAKTDDRRVFDRFAAAIAPP